MSNLLRRYWRDVVGIIGRALVFYSGLLVSYDLWWGVPILAVQVGAWIAIDEWVHKNRRPDV